MTKMYILLLTLLTISSLAHAGGGEFYCKGKQGKTNIELSGNYPGLMSLNSSNGTLSIDDREIAQFGKGDINIKKIARTVSAKNNHGDFLQGRLQDINTGIVNAEFIIVPGYGIFMVNVRLKCTVFLE